MAVETMFQINRDVAGMLFTDEIEEVIVVIRHKAVTSDGLMRTAVIYAGDGAIAAETLKEATKNFQKAIDMGRVKVNKVVRITTEELKNG